MSAVIFFDALDDLDRALARGRLRRQDQVFVPLPLRRLVGETAWDELGRKLKGVGVRVHVVPNLARVCVVSFDEMNAGMGPPTAAD